MLVVDDEPENLDLLYRTFRRDFEVLRAHSGHEALQILAEVGEVAVIISDQRMPEMKGTEFLSKTLSQFPNTVRIVLTGFTDVEDLVDAINAGQVYRYITKPWEPDELRGLVKQAAETYHLLEQHTQELTQARAEIHLMEALNQAAHTVSGIDAVFAAAASELTAVLGADGCTLYRVVAGECIQPPITHGQVLLHELLPVFLKTAIDTAQLTSIASPGRQQQTPPMTNWAQPVIYRNQVLACIVLHWHAAIELTPGQQRLFALGASHLAIVLQSQP